MLVPKVWGSELWIANTDRYCGKILTLNRGWQCSLHKHPIKDETFFVLSGRVVFELDGAVYQMEAGDTIHVPTGSLHRFTGIENAVIVEVSTHHDDADVVRAEPSRRAMDLDGCDPP